MSVLCSRLLLLLFEFLLDLSHLFSHTVVGAHCKTLFDELETKPEEQRRRSKVCKAFRKQGWHSVAQNSGEYCHDDKCRESGRENEESRMSHGHQRSYEESFISDFREDDHGEGKYEGVEGLYDTTGIVFWQV
jgi:hypothetical protein